MDQSSRVRVVRLCLIAVVGLGIFAVWPRGRVLPAAAVGISAAEKPAVRPPGAAGAGAAKTITRLEADGTRAEFKCFRRNQLVIKRRYEADGALESTTLYRTDKGGRILSCTVLDARGENLYRCVFGYRASDGVLVEEQVHDARVGKTRGQDPQPAMLCRISYVNDGKERVVGQVVHLSGGTASPGLPDPADGSSGDPVVGMSGIPAALSALPWDEP